MGSQMDSRTSIIDMSKQDCCGCGACYSICPVSCIEMVEDAEGFAYPLVQQDACIGCLKCEKACPVLCPEKELARRQVGGIFVIDDSSILEASTSGGAFTAVSRWVFSRGGVVFGVGYDEDGLPIHKCAQQEREIAEFRGSKYAQSRLGNTFHQVKKMLDEERYVLFSGTPCQVEGLVAFLGNKPERLVLVDVVCHAVPSPLVLRRYLQFLRQQEDCDMRARLSFRDKHPFGYQYSQITLYDNANEEVFYAEGVETDPFLRAFFSEICNRPSCYACRFKKRYRVSDVTIWDCFDAHPYGIKLNERQGANKILAQSARGEEIVSFLAEQGTVFIVDPDRLVEGEREMFQSVEMNKHRDQFLLDCAQTEDPALIFKKWFPKTLKTRVERSLRRLLASWGMLGWVKALGRKARGR